MGTRMIGLTNVQLVNRETGETFKIDRVEEIRIENDRKAIKPFINGVEGTITLGEIDTKTIKRIIGERKC